MIRYQIYDDTDHHTKQTTSDQEVNGPYCEELSDQSLLKVRHLAQDEFLGHKH